MALTSQQISGLNALNQKIAGGYQATDTDKANLSYATKQGYTYNPLPTGATKISDPNYLKTAGLTENQIYRSGQDIYKLPEVPKELPSTALTGQTPTIQPVEQTPVDLGMAGIQTGNEGLRSQLEYLNTPLPSQQKLTAIQERKAEVGEEYKTANLDKFESTMSKYNSPEYTKKAQEALAMAAKVEADYNTIAEQNLNRPISSRIIGGTADRIQRQKAVELAGISAVAQAYQGNVDMARNIANDAVNAQYQDQQTYLTNLQSQINSVYDDLSREEKVKADSLNLVIAERERAIEDEKVTKEGINELLLKAVEKGADVATAQRILNSKNVGQAILAGREFLQDITQTRTPEKIGVDSNGNDIFYDPTTKTIKTADQLTSNQLGVQVGTIKGLPSYDTKASNHGMTRSDRNNNPGNIKVSDYTKDFAGVTGVESTPSQDGGNFLIFENPQAGLDAIGRLLLEGKAYQGVNAETAIKKYNGGGAYGAKAVGLDPNGDFQSQIQDPIKRREVAKAIAMAEGWSGGVSTEPVALSAAQDWAESIRDGKAKLDDITSEVEKANPGLKSEVVKIMKTLPPSKAQITETQKIVDKLKELRDHSGLKSSVGPTAASRGGIFGLQGIGGSKDAFLGKADSLISQKALDSLISAKSQGATFGALSDRELSILKSAGTTLGAWGTEKDGKLKNFDVDEKTFKAELNKMITEYETLLTEAGVTQSLDSYLNANPQKVDEYNTILQANPNLTDDEILQVIIQ